MPKRSADDDGAEQARRLRARLTADLEGAEQSRKHQAKPEREALPPRNSFRGLPLELREIIYAFAFDELVRKPLHPYSQFPMNSRFEDYLSLLLVDRATSGEAKKVFEKDYAKHVTFYFEDAVTLYDMQRRADTIPFLNDVEFVLRDRTDLDPKGEIDNDLEGLGKSLYCSGENGFDASLPEPEFIGVEDVEPDDDDSFDHGLELVVKKHHCKSDEKCIMYDEFAYPPLAKSLRLAHAVWRMDVGSSWDAAWQSMRLKPGKKLKTEEVSITTFSGKLGDVSFAEFPVRNSKLRLMRFLLNQRRSCWSWLRARYVGKYPLSAAEYNDFIDGNVKYHWPISDIEPTLRLLGADTASDAGEDDTDEDESSDAGEDDQSDSSEDD